ncbi:hypothetical protein QTO34_010038 [Cnephaeus nilssonii]|uniref:G-protein coupled receptors family 1 profile domain-containing protein n=1 Tax=Cnephaeus nilssonii TaxID=3371016 RepID=A0AA40HFL8_CNENI|nr:hypothetical protein QTO34_010038 [Eptesicus nilssonii]
MYLTSCLAFFNSCLNPMLYIFLGGDFRKRLIDSLPASLERALTEDSAPTSHTTTKSASPPTEAELQEISRHLSPDWLSPIVPPPCPSIKHLLKPSCHSKPGTGHRNRLQLVRTDLGGDSIRSKNKRFGRLVQICSQIRDTDKGYGVGRMETGYTALQIFLFVAHGITCILGIMGNGLVIWVTGFRMACTVTTLCYMNLAIADFLFSATLPFFMVVNSMQAQWPYGWFLCKLFNTMIDTNLFASVFLIAFIALDRCICVLHPVWAQNHRTLSLAKKVIIVPWILALLLNLPVLIFFTTITDDNGDIYCDFNIDFWGDIGEEEKLQKSVTSVAIIGINRFVIGFTLPMSIIAICYGLIAAKIRNKGMIKSRRPLRVLTVVGASFFICWFPMQLCLLLNTLCARAVFEGNYDIIILLVSLTGTLAFFNSCLNPILYVFLGRDFRKRLIHSLPASLQRALTEDSAPTSHTTTKSASPPTEAELQEM